MAANAKPKPPRERPHWRRIFAAQESGLILVIVILGGILTSLCRVPIDDRVEIAPDATVATSPDGSITVTDAATTDTYNSTGENGWGWTLRDAGAERYLERHRTFNRFLSRGNLVGIAKDASFIAVMAVGAMGVIILGGIDLSVGSVYAMSAVVGATALHALEASYAGIPGGTGAPFYLSLPVGIGVCCLVGTLCGATSGAAIVGLRVHPFIITLGGMAVYRGLAFVISKGQSIGDFPDSYTIGAFKAKFLGTNPVPMVIMVGVAAAGWFILSRTVFGRRTYAIGGNETAARYAGIPVGRIKITWFAIGGLLAGLSAAMLLGYYGAASSDAGPGYELKVIAAAVVGGASLSGGRGTAAGAMLGALVIQMIDNGIVVLGINSNYTQIVIGLAIVIAVVVDQAKLRLTTTSR